MGQFTKGVVRKQVNRLDGSKTLEAVRQAEIQNGRVLLIAGQNFTPTTVDRFGEQTQGVTIEVRPGYRVNAFVPEADAEMFAKIKTLKHNDRVNVIGFPRRSGAVQITELQVLPPQAPVSEAPSQTTPLNQ